MTECQKETIRELQKEVTTKKKILEGIAMRNLSDRPLAELVRINIEYRAAKADYLQAQKAVDDFITALENQKEGVFHEAAL